MKLSLKNALEEIQTETAESDLESLNDSVEFSNKEITKSLEAIDELNQLVTVLEKQEKSNVSLESYNDLALITLNSIRQRMGLEETNEVVTSEKTKGFIGKTIQAIGKVFKNVLDTLKITGEKNKQIIETKLENTDKLKSNNVSEVSKKIKVKAEEEKWAYRLKVVHDVEELTFENIFQNKKPIEKFYSEVMSGLNTGIKLLEESKKNGKLSLNSNLTIEQKIDYFQKAYDELWGTINSKEEKYVFIDGQGPDLNGVTKKGNMVNYFIMETEIKINGSVLKAFYSESFAQGMKYKDSVNVESLSLDKIKDKDYIKYITNVVRSSGFDNLWDKAIKIADQANHDMLIQLSKNKTGRLNNEEMLYYQLFNLIIRSLKAIRKSADDSIKVYMSDLITYSHFK